jgi:hypothetical protein
LVPIMSPCRCLALLLLSGLLFARTPARGDANPEPPPRTQNVEGTEWAGTSNGRPCAYRFLKGGVLSYQPMGGGRFRNTGTWKQKGGSIYLEMNNKYAEYHGTIKGNDMEGTASNRRGLKWTWKVKKK